MSMEMEIVTENGTRLSLSQIQRAVAGMVTDEAALFGVPLPAMTDVNHPLCIAKRIKNREHYESCGREMLKNSNTHYVNSRGVMGHEVIVFRDKEGLGVVRMPYAHWRLNNVLQSVVLRFGAVTYQAELKAMQRLASYVSDRQYGSYILSGAFIETSKRSGVKYFFRKGAPTLALRVDEDGSKCLAALCLHPMAYFEGTSAGSMAPTDEVIAHVSMMRGDEHYFWRKANQHKSWDARSGV